MDIQSGSRQVRERDTGRDIAPPTPPRGQSNVPLRRSLQKRMAAAKAARVIAEGAAMGVPSGTERPYFKVCSRCCDICWHVMAFKHNAANMHV